MAEQGDEGTKPQSSLRSVSWAAAIEAWRRRNPALILLALIAGTLSSLIIIGGFASDVRELYQDRFDWRSREYAKVASLHGGISITKFEEVLGSPTFVRASTDGSLTESTFDGREYWVQAIHDKTGTVMLVAVTSCGRSFHPQFTTPRGKTVTLNETRFDIGVEDVVAHRYYAAAATRNNFFFDEYYGGNPGLYKTYFLGIDDACPAVANSLMEQVSELKANPFPDFYAAISEEGLTRGPAVAEFRSRSVINTYAETAPRLGRSGLPSVSVILQEFQIGVDRRLTRTIHPGQSSGLTYPTDRPRIR